MAWDLADNEEEPNDDEVEGAVGGDTIGFGDVTVFLGADDLMLLDDCDDFIFEWPFFFCSDLCWKFYKNIIYNQRIYALCPSTLYSLINAQTGDSSSFSLPISSLSLYNSVLSLWMVSSEIGKVKIRNCKKNTSIFDNAFKTRIIWLRQFDSFIIQRPTITAVLFRRGIKYSVLGKKKHVNFI